MEQRTPEQIERENNFFEIIDLSLAKELIDELLEWHPIRDNYINNVLENNFKKISSCCGSPIYEETDICMNCREHCGINYK